MIVGGKENDWRNSHANSINGDLVTELSGSGVTARSVIGGIYGCSDGGGSDPRVGLPLKGNALVTIGAGSKVTGNIIGSSVPMHGLPFTHTGNTWVRVLALQNETNTEHTINGSPAGYVVGASMRADGNNRETSANLTGSATVEVTLTEGDGNFEKTILGGSFNNSTNADSTYTISGNTSVTINAPGVTFPRAIYAAGQGKNVTVQGKASVTLKGGTFTGALGVGINGATANDSELVIDGGESGIDLSQATVAEDFKALTLKSNLNLGTNRLPNATFTMEGAQTLSIAVTDEEIATRRVVLGRTESVPEGLTIAPSGLPEEEAPWELVEIGGVLYYGASSTDREWVTPSAGSAWSDGLRGFQAGDNVAFGANPAQEEVTFTNDIRVGTMTVSGDYTFAGRHTLSADRLTINKDATLMLSSGTPAKGRYIRLLLLTRATSGNNCDGIALAEMKLMLAEQEVAWNGATVTATQAAENGSHKDDHLIDGDLGTKWYWATGSTAFDNCSLTLDAGEGKTFTFDAYRLAMADQNGRNPTSWELAVSNDGVYWETVDKRSYATSEVNAWTPNAWVETSFGVAVQPTISSLSPISVAGAIGGLGRLEGSVTFVEGSQLLASPNGALTLSGPVSGTVKVVLPEDAEQWQNALDVPVLWTPETDALTLQWTTETGYELVWRDGCYRLRRRFSTELSQNADWFSAGWKDINNEGPTTSDAWQNFRGETDFTITAKEDLTVNVPSKGYHVDRFAVTESEHLLTLSGGKLTPNALTVEGNLSATSSTLTLPSETTINGTLTFEASGSVAMPAMAGSGTFVKTGAGTLTLTSEVNVVPQIIVRGGTLSLPSGSTWGTVYPNLPNIVVEADAIVDLPSSSGSVASTEATITLRNGGIFSFSNGNAWSGRPIACAFHVENDGVKPASFQGSYYGDATKFTGRISGHGRVVFEQGQANSYSLACPISDDEQGTLSVRFADTNSAITVSGASTYTGGTEIASAVTASNAEAFGRGPLMIASGATLKVASNTTLNVYGALSGLGTITGPTVNEAATACALHLAEGASLDASEATAEACLTLNGTLTAAGTIAVTLPQDVTSTRRLLAWASTPEGVTFEAAEATPTAPTARLVAKADGLYCEFLTLDEGAQATFEGLLKAAQRQLAAVAFTAGATSVAGISGTTAKRSLTTAEIDAALLCFGGVLTATVSESAATLTVTYDFGIADMAYDREAGVLTVTAKVQGAEGAQTATFVAGSTVELLAEDEVVATVAIGETETSEIQLPVSKETTATLLETPRPLKVRVKK